MEEFTLVHGKRYKAKIHLGGFDDYATNETIKNMLEGYGFSDIEVKGRGRNRQGSATWNGETVTGPLDKHIVSVEEVEEPAPTPTPAVDPIPIPVSPPVFEKPDKPVEKKAKLSFEEENEE